MGQTEPGQVWLDSSNTYVRYKTYGFSLVKNRPKHGLNYVFSMFKDSVEHAEIQCIRMD